MNEENSLSESDYACVADRAASLGCSMPDGWAALPENFDTAASRQELVTRGEASTVRTLFRNHDVPSGSFMPSSERTGFIHNKSFDWAALLFVSASIISNDPNLMPVALGVISNYLTDLFKGIPSKRVRLSIVVERKGNKTCKKITYEGDVAGLKTIAPALRRIADE